MYCHARAFTSLSERLGGMALALHASLFEATRQEALPAAQLAALASLVRAAPYARLPVDLLHQTLQVRAQSLQLHAYDDDQPECCISNCCISNCRTHDPFTAAECPPRGTSVILPK